MILPCMGFRIGPQHRHPGGVCGKSLEMADVGVEGKIRFRIGELCVTLLAPDFFRAVKSLERQRARAGYHQT